MIGYPYLRIGTLLSGNYQPLDPDLTGIAALGTAANKMLYTTAEDTWAETDITAVGRAILDDADVSAQRTTLGLAIGSDVQAYDANLAAIAGDTWTGVNSITILGTIATGTWQATDVGIAYGGTGQSTAQAAIDALSAVDGGTNEYVLTKDTASGNALWKAAAAIASFSSRASAYLGAAQTISNATWTVIAFDTENWDNDSEFDIVTNKGRFTATAAGYYHITARYTMSAIVAGRYAYIRIKKNGSIDIALHQIYPAGSEVPNMQISADVYLDGSTDYIEIRCYHNSGGDETLTAAVESTRVDIHRFA